MVYFYLKFPQTLTHTYYILYYILYIILYFLEVITWLHPHDYLKTNLIEINVATDEGNSRNET